MGVWIAASVALFFPVAATVVLLMYWLTDDLPNVNVRLQLFNANPVWWTSMAITLVLSIGGGVSLLMLRRSTLAWWVASISFTVIATFYTFFLSGAGMAIFRDGVWLVKAFGNAIPLVIYAYAKRLRIEGVIE